MTAGGSLYTEAAIAIFELINRSVWFFALGNFLTRYLGILYYILKVSSYRAISNLSRNYLISIIRGSLRISLIENLDLLNKPLIGSGVFGAFTGTSSWTLLFLLTRVYSRYVTWDWVAGYLLFCFVVWLIGQVTSFRVREGDYLVTSFRSYFASTLF